MLSILVVDDDPMICKTMGDVIRLRGITVILPMMVDRPFP